MHTLYTGTRRFIYQKKQTSSRRKFVHSYAANWFNRFSRVTIRAQFNSFSSFGRLIIYQTRSSFWKLIKTFARLKFERFSLTFSHSVVSNTRSWYSCHWVRFCIRKANRAALERVIVSRASFFLPYEVPGSCSVHRAALMKWSSFIYVLCVRCCTAYSPA